jgi:hypothetical protein
MAQFVELDLDQGTDFSYDLDLTTDDGSPINVANYSFTSSIRKSYYSTNDTASFTITVVNTANGNLKFSMTSSTTANIKAGRYLFDVKQVDSGNTTSRILEGVIRVNPQITR